MIPPVIRRCLPPICLVALIAVVWALPYRPDCNSLARGDDPAIARIDNQCILLSHYAESLYLIGVTIERTEQGLLPYHPDSDYQRRWYDRVKSYGPETIALANAVRDSTLYQRAVAEGHTPSKVEVSARLDQDRLWWENSYDIVRLVKLAQDQDLAGFSKLAAETRNPDIRRMLEDLTPSELMEAMKESDWRQLEQMVREGEAYLESFGHERYLREILPVKLRREMAVLKLQDAVLEASADGPYAEVPRLAWLAYQQRVFEGVNIQLTRAAPSRVSADRVLTYLAEVLQEEQDELSEEYRRWLQRRGERLRSTPPPLRPNPN